MNLRTRLIVAFFLLSVVPLAAVTFYTHRSNIEAVQTAAGAEAELLAGELSQRMQMVTAQLSQRVERALMTVSGTSVQQTSATTQAPAATRGTPAAPATASAAPTVDEGAESARREVTDALGDLAMLINNVDIIQGRRGGRGRGGLPPGERRGGAPPGPPPVAGAPPAVAPPAAPAPPVAPSAPGVAPTQPAPAPGAVAPGTPALSADPFAGRRGGSGRSGDPNAEGRFRGDRFGPSSGEGRGGTSEAQAGAAGGQPPPGERRGGPPPEAQAAAEDPTRIRIDMEPIRRELIQQLVPDGNFEQLTPEERRRVFDEVNQRILGIQQGIQMLQERVADRVADAKALSEAAAAAAASKAAAEAKAAAPAAPSPPPAPTAPRRTSAFSGSQLAVSVEQDGEMLGQLNAEINLPNLLAMVFTTTKRDRGEVPFAVSKEGALHAPSEADLDTIDMIESPALEANTPPGTTIVGNWVIATTTDPTGLESKFGIARPLGDAVAELRRKTALNAGFGLGLIVLALVGIVPLSSRLTRNLQSLSEGVSRISQGDYSARVEVKAKDEVGRLAGAFNRMAADIETHQRSMVEQERIRRELELGRQIQHDMLPQVPLKLGLTEVRGVSVPAREVGGDFFNYFPLNNGTVALLVGDVSGKGVGAALLMANIQAALRTRLSLGQDLASLARELDREIELSTPGPVYATLYVGIFDPATRVLRSVNAGHNPQYVIRQDYSLERIESTGLPIGLLAGHGYTEQRLQLAAGDRLFFYTDGCVEAESKSGDMFGVERLEAALSAAQSTDDVLADVETAITGFRDGVELSDDATMMVVTVG